MMRRAVILAGILVLAVLLAFPLRLAVYEAVVVPIAYILWALGLFYHALPQFVWWLLVAVFILYLFGRSVFSNIRLSRRQTQVIPPPRGQVEFLAESIRKSEKGIYNKWLVANRLGRLAYQILVQRDSGRTRTLFEPLDGPDWNASPDLTRYLHAGLQGSFADYPNQSNPFTPPEKTPLDQDVRDVVEFLETKIDNSIG
jgi:hypothetical protein